MASSTRRQALLDRINRLTEAQFEALLLKVEFPPQERLPDYQRTAIKLLQWSEAQGNYALEELKQAIFEVLLPADPREDTPAEDKATDHVDCDAPEIDSKRYIIIRTEFEDKSTVNLSAYDTLLGRSVLIRRLKPAAINDADIRTQFLVEAHLRAQLLHPHIRTLFTIHTQHTDRISAVFEALNGQPLISVLDRLRVPEDEPRVDDDNLKPNLHMLIEYLAKVSEAIAYAHARGVLHTNIQPQYITLGTFGELSVEGWNRAIITQISHPDMPNRIYDDSQHHPIRLPANLSEYINQKHRYPADNSSKFSAPELAHEEESEITAAADVYSLGKLLHVILRLFDGRDSGAESHQDFTTTDSPHYLYQLAEQSTHQDPELRPANAYEFLSCLNEWMAGIASHREAEKLVDRAILRLVDIEKIRDRISGLHEEIANLDSHLMPHSPVADKRLRWYFEDRIEQLDFERYVYELQYLQLLRSAVIAAPKLSEAHARLAEFYYRRHKLAESSDNRRASRRFLTLLIQHDRSGAYAEYLRGRGLITLTTYPKDATANLFEYKMQDRVYKPHLVGAMGSTPIINRPIQMGSYLIKISAVGYEELTVPIQINRCQHWTNANNPHGSRLPIRLLPKGTLGENDIFICQGYFTCGGDDQAMRSLPRKNVWVPDFIMQRFPVTNAEYIVFLNALRDEFDLEEALKWAPRLPGKGNSGSLVYHYDHDSGFSTGIDADGDVWHPQEPVTCITWHAARRYAQWYSEKTQQSWRLPFEYEWEKAARGVDRRTYPWGNYFDASFTCMQDSHQGIPNHAKVEEYPDDKSPYGVRGMAGNVRDWCLDTFSLAGLSLTEDNAFLPEQHLPQVGKGTVVLRGGAYTNHRTIMRVCYRLRRNPEDPSDLTGFRLVRSVD